MFCTRGPHCLRICLLDFQRFFRFSYNITFDAVRWRWQWQWRWHATFSLAHSNWKSPLSFSFCRFLNQNNLLSFSLSAHCFCIVSEVISYNTRYMRRLSRYFFFSSSFSIPWQLLSLFAVACTLFQTFILFVYLLWCFMSFDVVSIHVLYSKAYTLCALSILMFILILIRCLLAEDVFMRVFVGASYCLFSCLFTCLNLCLNFWLLLLL